MRMFTGDLKPDLEITLSDGSGSVDIGDATAVRIIGERGGVELFDRAPTTTEVVGATSLVTMQWQAGDTDIPGRIAVEVEVTWPGDKKQTFRPSGGIDISRDFDYVEA